jgi:hypothetical protein
MAMSRTMTWLLAGAALTLCAGAGAALAQDARPDARRPGPVDERVERREMWVQRGEHRAGHIRDVLQLRPEQEGALKAFLDATRPGPGPDPARLDPREAPRTAAERLSHMEARADARHAAVKGRIVATRSFYAQLDARQKKAFDSMPMLVAAGTRAPPMRFAHRMQMMRRMPHPPGPPRS